MPREIIESHMPGIIRNIGVAVGDRVKEGDILCLLEAMKMENPILAPFGGRITEISVSNSQAVKRGQALFAIES
jgi:biotin carboxyl carrier protein